MAVWVWAVLAAAAAAIFAAIAGAQLDALTDLGGLPRLPIGGNQLTSGGVVTAMLALAAALAGAVLGGLAGMRFHRKVDRVDVEDRT